METRTNTKLAGLTDVGLFERIATAVLRLDPEYEGLTHTGINPVGKTRKSPVDGLVFTGESGSRLIIVHHTTAAIDSLEKKWLLDPGAVQRRKRSKSAPPTPGDVVKSLEIIRDERVGCPGLAATLVLATNQEPDEKLVRKVVAAGRQKDVKVDVWSRSRIAARLDTDSRGQFIRRKLLQIEEELLSRELVLELSRRSIAGFYSGDDASIRVPRTLDAVFGPSLGPVTFVVGGSGSGKTVAGHKALAAHVSAGGGAIVVSDAAVETALSLEQAVMATLHQLQPTLAPGQNPFGQFSEEDPLLILVEDVNRSVQPSRLVEKVAGWSPQEGASGRPAWRLICPVWPHVLSGVQIQLADRVARMSIRPAPMSHDEAIAAVVAHASSVGVAVPADRAAEIATELGDDPLLIALNKDWSAPMADEVIDRFVESALNHTAQQFGHVAAELRASLLELGEALLRHRRFEPAWSDVLEWRLSSVENVRAIAQAAEIFTIGGPSTDARLRFRHDRVRDWVLAEAALALDREGRLDDGLLSEPALAEVIGAVLVRGSAPRQLVARVLSEGPLALFHALRLGPREGAVADRLSEASANWLRAAESRGAAMVTMRWQAMAALGGVVGEHVCGLIALFPEQWPTGMIAVLRNGDVRGGVALSRRFDVQTVVTWAEGPLQAMMPSRRAAMAEELGGLIEADDDSVDGKRSALIEFAGVLGDPGLASALERCWARDDEREARLPVYLWAMARCATPEAASRLLDPICTLWAALPSKRQGNMPSPRDDLAAHSIRSAFERAVPVGALGYFVERARQPDLSWQIEYMLHGIDDPDAVQLQVERGTERLQAGGDRYVFASQAREHWRRANEGYGKPMSASTRDNLLRIWQDIVAVTERRIAAFDLWAAGRDASDIAILCRAASDQMLGDRVLRARLERGDTTAIPVLIGKLDTDVGRPWWFYARHVWSSAMYDALDRALERESSGLPIDENTLYEIGATYTRVIMRLPAPDAERLLLRSWGCFGRALHFVQAALYVATEDLVARADAVIKASADPDGLFRHLTMHYGIRTLGEMGITREEQIQVLVPYFSYLRQEDLGELADVCNENGWHDLRRRLIDPHLDEARVETAHSLRGKLDAILAQGHRGFIDLDIDRLLQAGVSWQELAETLRGWLAEQASLPALELAERAIRHGGSRGDTGILADWAGGDTALLQDKMCDLDFALRRRDARRH
ncbi:MAG: hypothetical protein AAF628_18235 [Planctomycetota bacterium]